MQYMLVISDISAIVVQHIKHFMLVRLLGKHTAIFMGALDASKIECLYII